MAIAEEHGIDTEGVRLQVHPRLHLRARRFLENDSLVLSLIEEYGSPLNVVFPQNLENNVRDFESVYKKHKLGGRIYYVTKPCKSRALMREAKQYNIGIDVSSLGSLQETLRTGWATGRIVANGPKNTAYLKAAVENKVLINADNMQELEKIVLLSRASGIKTNVGVRLCDFKSPAVDFTPYDNTFGIRIKHLEWILDFLVEYKDTINFHGFCFHIAGSNDEQKVVAIENTIQASFRAIRLGLRPQSINIGGGYPIMYADKCQEWHDYQEGLKKSVVQGRATGIWDNGGLGYKIQNGVLAGHPVFIDHAPFRAKAESLDHILLAKLSSFDNACVADILRDSLIDLDIEPGKGMLDQCGLTLGEVMFHKESGRGENLVGLDMNRTNKQAAEQKILTSPIIIYRNRARNKKSCGGVFYMGNLCLSYDILQYNKTYPEFLPEEGDVVAFPNTAAYAMDFSESESLMQPLARKIVVLQDGNNWQYFPDEQDASINREVSYAC